MTKQDPLKQHRKLSILDAKAVAVMRGLEVVPGPP